MNTPLLVKSWSSAALLALPVIVGWTGTANATGRDDQWYIGFGGTGSWLAPDPVQSGNNTVEFLSGGGTFLIGKDLDERSSFQLQGFSLGEAILESGDSVSYNAADASIVYRFFDTRDNNLNQSVFGTSLFGRFGLGFAQRESDVDLERGDGVYFGAGAGFETYFTQNIAIRGEAFFHDIDAVSSSLSLVFRFGGTRRSRGGLIPSTTSSAGTQFPAAPSSVPTAPTAPSAPAIVPTVPPPRVQEIPTTPTTPITETSPTVPTIPTVPTRPQAPTDFPDSDNDGVADSADSCLTSTPGYPVRANGCPLFDGVLSGIRFIESSPDLEAESSEQLNFLADMMVNDYPSSRIELHSHTDNEGDVRSQAILTRARLKTVGMYLVDRGVSANRLVLRSFGGSRPLFDNATAEGRASNNRIEILERPR